MAPLGGLAGGSPGGRGVILRISGNHFCSDQGLFFPDSLEFQPFSGQFRQKGALFSQKSAVSSHNSVISSQKKKQVFGRQWRKFKGAGKGETLNTTYLIAR